VITDIATTEILGAIVEAAAGDDATGPLRFGVRVIRAGLSLNGNFYGDDTLRRAVPLFEGVRVLAKSDAEHLAGGGKDVRNLIGKLSGARFVEGASADTGEILATLTLIDRADPLSIKLAEAVKSDMADLFGLSIDARAKAREARIGGRTARMVTELTAVKSVDLIVEPGAGGGFIDIQEARDEDDMALRGTLINTIRAKRPDLLAGRNADALTDDEIETLVAEAVATPTSDGVDADAVARVVEARIGAATRMRERVRRSKLPPAAQDRVVADLEGEATLTEAAIDARIKSEADYLAPFAGGRIEGLGETAVVESVEDRRGKIATMLDAFFDSTHTDHASARSIRECYVEITGDRDVTGLRRHCDEARLRESLGPDDFDVALGDAVHRRLLADYNNRTAVDVWRDMANVVNATDFKNMEVVRWGGYGDLPTVDPGYPYTELPSPAEDDPATYRVRKRGGTERITLELIKNDQSGLVQQVPIKLARAAKRTLSRAVLGLLPANPVIGDGKTWIHADHGNLGTVALGEPSLAARRLAMKRQRESGSNEPIGILPRFLWVPDTLEEVALDLFRRADNLDPTFVQSLKLDVRPVWCWEDDKDWAITCDPSDCPVIEVAFLDGREEPELFVQDSPSSGSLFSHDAVTYKIRHIWGVVPVDPRGVQWSSVA